MKTEIDDIKKEWEKYIVDCQSKDYDPPNPDTDPIDYLTWWRNRDELGNKICHEIIDLKIRITKIEDTLNKNSMKRLFSPDDIMNTILTLCAMSVFIYGVFYALNWLIGVWFMNDVKFNKKHTLISIEERNVRKEKEKEFRIILQGKRDRFLHDALPISKDTSLSQAGLDFVTDLHQLTMSNNNENKHEKLSNEIFKKDDTINKLNTDINALLCRYENKCENYRRRKTWD